MKIKMFLLTVVCLTQLASAQSTAFQYISPRPHSILNSKGTNIILRQGDAIDRSTLRGISLSVVGSVSGLHEGSLTLSDDDKTLLFRPFVSFAPNEVVTVGLPNGIRTASGDAVGPVSFSFMISPAKATPERSALSETESESQYTMRTDSLPADFPKITVDPKDTPYSGKIFIANKPAVSNPPYGNYVLVADNDGNILKYRKFSKAESNFKVLPDGRLSMSENARHIILDTALTPVDTFTCGNGYTADSHDFLLLPNGHALLFASDPQPVDMSLIVPGGKPDATVIGSVIQELDADRNVVFQWRTWDHIPILSSYIDLTKQTVDYAHMNSLEVDAEGNIYTVMRHTSNIVKINRLTGDVEWILGGKQNEFTFINENEANAPNYFSYPHHVTILPNGNLTLFDNGDQHVPKYSRGVEYKLDVVNKTATMVWEFRHSPDIYTSSGGSMQRLPNGNSVIGWSRAGSISGNPAFTEVRPDKAVALEVFFPAGQFSYRSYKFPWISQTPAASVKVEEVLQGNTYIFNNATDTTGVAITFQELNADLYANAIVTKYDYAPVGPDFVEEPPIMAPHFFTIENELINSYTGIIHVDVTKYPAITSPEKVVVYVQPQFSEIFIPLPTGYDSVTKEIGFSTSDFGAFAFGVPVQLTTLPPVPISPRQNEVVNGESSVKLQWGTRGIVQTHRLQIATDSLFASPVVDVDNLTTPWYVAEGLNNDTRYWWRVKMVNTAGTSLWSDSASFFTASPYIALIYPNGGERLYNDSVYVIRWNSNVRDTVNVILMKDLTHTLFIADSIISRTNAVLWNVPSALDTDSSYSIVVTSLNRTGVSDSSDLFFTVSKGITGAPRADFVIRDFSLHQNYPNPFNPSTSIRFEIPVSGVVSLKIFDILGKEIDAPLSGKLSAGNHSVEWNAGNLPSGIYFYRLQTGKNVQTKKMILLK